MYKQMVIASGSDNDVSLRHYARARHLPEGNLVATYHADRSPTRANSNEPCMHMIMIDMPPQLATTKSHCGRRALQRQPTPSPVHTRTAAVSARTIRTILSHSREGTLNINHLCREIALI